MAVTDEQREQIKRFMLDGGHIMHKAALIMLLEAQQKGISPIVAEYAVSTAAMLVSAQMFNGGRDQFIDGAAEAFDCGDLYHEGTETRQ